MPTIKPNPNESVPKLLFSRKEAAYSLGLSLRSIAFLLARGELKYRKVGNKTLIPYAELVKFSKQDHDGF